MWSMKKKSIANSLAEHKRHYLRLLLSPLPPSRFFAQLNLGQWPSMWFCCSHYATTLALEPKTCPSYAESLSLRSARLDQIGNYGQLPISTATIGAAFFFSCSVRSGYYMNTMVKYNDLPEFRSKFSCCCGLIRIALLCPVSHSV